MSVTAAKGDNGRVFLTWGCITMKKVLTTAALAAAVATIACAATPGQKLADVAPYPAAQEGYQRHVIWLPQQADEELYKLEIVPGQMLQTDCNTRAMAGTLKEHTLEGWGYTYYELSDVRGPMSTMMACPDNSTVEAFVPVRGEGTFLRYNSKLPVVVYAPATIEVRYRFWAADTVLKVAGQE